MLMIIKGHFVELCLAERDWLLLLSVIPETATGILRSLGFGSRCPKTHKAAKDARSSALAEAHCDFPAESNK